MRRAERGQRQFATASPNGKKTNREEGRRDFIEDREENPTEEEGISNRQVSSTFVSPLT
jgi:hypothetical protein